MAIQLIGHEPTYSHDKAVTVGLATDVIGPRLIRAFSANQGTSISSTKTGWRRRWWQNASRLLDATSRPGQSALSWFGEAARYAADHAFRQYDAMDPANRLVAGELEARWNASQR